MLIKSGSVAPAKIGDPEVAMNKLAANKNSVEYFMDFTFHLKRLLFLDLTRLIIWLSASRRLPQLGGAG
jgi:hypothetical protein